MLFFERKKLSIGQNKNHCDGNDGFFDKTN